MCIVRVSPELEVSVHNFPAGDYISRSRLLRELIGSDCTSYGYMRPERLYTDLRMKGQPTKVPGQCISMLADEDGSLKELPCNIIGSYLYESDKHSWPVTGNILFVGEEWTGDGFDYCGIDDFTLGQLVIRLKSMIYAMKASMVYTIKAKRGGVGSPCWWR